MADVRSLLRQQRAARRIAHPHAAYSEAGKLLCTVCHEQVKVESLWDGHIRSPTHTQRVQKLQESSSAAVQPSASNKRKLDNEKDVSMADEEEDGLRNKRSRLDVAGPDHDAESNATSHETAAEKTTPARIQPLTPPLLRRSSGTPSQGVEIEMPSRPATPVVVRTDAAGANGTAGAASRSPLRPQKEPSTIAGFVAATLAPTDRTGGTPSQTDTPSSGAQGDKGTQDIDEDEWAAFEADLLEDTPNGTSRPPAMDVPSDAVIFAPVMTADELAAKSAEEERERRRLTGDIELDNEKEDATRALEEEFEDMEELEARVRKLKERRDALRKNQGSLPLAVAVAGPEEEKRLGKENAAEASNKDEDDDENDEDEDDWAGFRFKG
ncbi:hypothetical protein GE09DRAFT_506662 [Coniochaeta sp. 2T2.1]|nr:hypothetical protein GE09DRAFT_506662 [Coniochaeta sp. 2T2.1]